MIRTACSVIQRWRSKIKKESQKKIQTCVLQQKQESFFVISQINLFLTINRFFPFSYTSRINNIFGAVSMTDIRLR